MLTMYVCVSFCQIVDSSCKIAAMSCSYCSRHRQRCKTCLKMTHRFELLCLYKFSGVILLEYLSFIVQSFEKKLDMVKFSGFNV